jgi:hypothetical protein
LRPDPRKLSSTQVAAITGVTDRTVRNWCSKKHQQHPFKRQPDGRRYLWDAGKLFDWLIDQGKNSEAVRLQGYMESLEKPDPRATAVAEFAEAATPRATVPASDISIFEARDQAAQLVQDTTAAYAGAAPRDKLLIAKSLKELLETFLKVDREAFERDQRLRPKVELSDALKIIGQAMSTARTNLMSLCFSLPAELATLDDPAVISDYLQRQFVSALRTLEQKFLTAKVEDYLP